MVFYQGENDTLPPSHNISDNPNNNTRLSSRYALEPDSTNIHLRLRCTNMSDITERIRQIVEELAALPNGYISRKIIGGKGRIYLH